MRCVWSWKGWDLRMKNTDTQLREILSRKEKVCACGLLKKRFCFGAGSMILTLSLMILATVWMPKLSGRVEASSSADYGSLILGAPALCYVLIGLFCFALGVEATLLCLRVKQWKESGHK